MLGCYFARFNDVFEIAHVQPHGVQACGQPTVQALLTFCSDLLLQVVALRSSQNNRGITSVIPRMAYAFAHAHITYLPLKRSQTRNWMYATDTLNMNLQRLKQWFDFNRWYLRRQRPPWDTGISPPELMAFIQSHRPGRALDLGCGTGTNAITLAQHGWRVVGVDFAIKAIATARHKASQARLPIHFRVGDVTQLDDLSDPFDLILDIGCFHCLSPEGRARYAQNSKQLLAPSGTFLLYAHFKASPNASSFGLFGLVDDDLQVFAPELDLTARQDGLDTASHRHSAWLTFNKHILMQ
jgi:SAM-dependent methyltransferase